MRPILFALFTLTCCGICSAADDVHSFLQVPGGLDEVPIPKGTKMTGELVSLGKQLYFDKRLSKDKSISCASCHDPKHGWADPNPVSSGVGGQKGGRNAPTVINTAFNRFQFWDGRAKSLEEQALGPIQNPIEMGMAMGGNDGVIERLNSVDGYRRQFEEVFGGEVTEGRIAVAIAAFERTILSGNAPYDKFEDGDKEALSPAAKRGMELFFGKANCSACHAGANFTDNAFHNIGIGMDKPDFDKGRVVVSGLGGDTGSFKTPTLREIKRTGPYMHDGSIKTLREVVEHYDKGGIKNEYLDEELFELNLTENEKSDLVIFLEEGLSSESYPDISAPDLPE
ncbi:cytochrome-c peroxidase [Stratiformator vulcanicus]|uniref:Cytochrome c551 peroxidase n=1 Tax=Stratiformator vulcanicus TaxID=2527980 RepID=A0A517R3W8_9PLAN|nr:cytochrome c peroxidase [Stratiformator vulcanicus]QDT38547.1 Cytochrome c551 peroxidase precursor [Stratiformator vulcanicus]